MKTIADDIDSLFSQYSYECFMDGMGSKFEDALLKFIRENGDVVFEHLENAIENTKYDTGREALVILGRIWFNDGDRRGKPTILRFLKSTSPVLRDAAAQALDGCNDKTVKPHLEKAAAREPVDFLREYMNGIVKQLE